MNSTTLENFPMDLWMVKVKSTTLMDDLTQVDFQKVWNKAKDN